jgi:thiamine pyrophosphate-dependent acetolactate synthase large subunit-like protein
MTGDPGARDTRYGSDEVVALLGSLGITHVALNPGASIRGLHESLVHAGQPALVLALHEEVAVAIAHGYAKAARRPMGVMLHDLVGLQHASMAIFNAWVDQVPMVLLGGSGPADSERRRAWIDWIHSPRWQSLTVRDIVKWDDEPRSLAALRRSLVRAYSLAVSPPQAPTYIAIDALLQEEPVEEQDQALAAPQVQVSSLTAPAPDLERAASLIAQAERPVILTDLTGRTPEGYAALIEVAETLAAPVVDLGGRHNFPNDHWADLTDDRAGVLAWADLVLCLDLRDVVWGTSEVDLATHANHSLLAPGTRVVTIGLGNLLHRGFLDREDLLQDELRITADTATALPMVVGMLESLVSAPGRDRRREWVESRSSEVRERSRAAAARAGNARPISPARIAAELWALISDSPWLLANGTLSGWARRLWRWNEFACYLGLSGGAGLGYGVGAAIGAALAVGEDRLIIDLQADGDLLYTSSALWTAAHHRLPMLIVAQNNRSYGKDRLHQATIARTRQRGEGRVHVGIDIDDPPINLGLLADSQGVEGIGPITEPSALRPALERGVAAARERRPVLVDVVVGRE